MSLDEFSEMHARIEASGDEIERTVVGRDLQDHFGVIAGQWFEIGCQHHLFRPGAARLSHSTCTSGSHVNEWRPCVRL